MSLSAVALVATPVLAFLGVLLGHLATRRGATELDRWRKREETMRLVRWATELALHDEALRSAVGLEVLNALLEAPLLDGDDRLLVAAVFDAAAGRATLMDQGGRPP